jgi:HEAT repeat protein
MRATKLLVAASVVLLAGLASAQKPAPKPPPKPAKIDVGPPVQKLKSGSEEQIRSALDELRLAGAGAAAAAPAIGEVLEAGLSEPLSLQAIDTLADLESPEGSRSLSVYANHRILALRRAAVRALTRTRGPAAVAPLRRALGDPDPQIRGTAAAGLGALKAKDAVPDLFAALDHKVNEAASAIGQLCGPEQCEQLAGTVGRLPFEVVTSGLDQVLFRPAAEVSDDTKIKVIARLRELGTAEANRFLKDVEKRLPKDTSARVRQAVEQAVKATAGGSQ